ncbi:MAG: Nif3-like dinuclear metal center hexameric protein [Chitinophagales bacterium]|jgi:dinuclear metal center YbgI/SA1388 family protein|nr:Nif3-like dinuclear metal center hexameric protein [Sphingobacteriales bacterium]
MIVKDIISILENWAPPAYQESYDNSGLLTGDAQMSIERALITLDCTEEVIDEAIRENCQLIIAHHPIIFSGLKKLTGRNYVERTIIKAIKNDIAIYAIHTNLDNIQTGVNQMMAQRLGLKNCKILRPKKNLLRKLVCYVPKGNLESVSSAIFEAGAGHIGNYSHCGFSSEGIGSFMGNNQSNPAIGSPDKLEKVEESRFETVFPSYLESRVIQALMKAHPYEEVAYDVYAMENSHWQVGSGLIGEIDEELSLIDFLTRTKDKFQLKTLKYTDLSRNVRRIALCGGSGSFLRLDAAASGADVYLSSDFKYHEWFDAEGKLSYVDIGHYESEQFTKELIFNYLEKNALSLQSKISKVNTNPVNYL